MKLAFLFSIILFSIEVHGQTQSQLDYYYWRFYSNAFRHNSPSRIQMSKYRDPVQFDFTVEDTNNLLSKYFGEKLNTNKLDRSRIPKINDIFHDQILHGIKNKIALDLRSFGSTTIISPTRKVVKINSTLEVFAVFPPRPSIKFWLGYSNPAKVRINIKVQLNDSILIEKKYEDYYNSFGVDNDWEGHFVMSKSKATDIALGVCLRRTLDHFYEDLFKALGLMKIPKLLVEGSVMDSITNEKLKAQIIFKSDSSYSTISNNGNFKIEIPKSRITVAIDLPKYNPYRRQFDLSNTTEAKNWVFKMIPKIKPKVLIAGHVVDSLTNEGLTTQVIFKSDTVYSAVSTNGNFKIEIPKSQVTAAIDIPNYYPYRRQFDLSNTIEAKNWVFKMIPKEKPKALSFNNVLFKVGTTDMLDESITTLNDLASFLISDQNAIIELKGYTDTLGDSEKDLELSNERVDVVRSYLIDKGVNVKRIKGLGYGGTKPLSKGKSEDERKLNRRVEFVITYE